MSELPNKYDHKLREKHWQSYWLEQGTYHWDASESRENSYVIDTPPPTVSGLLHMGHIFSYTQADFIARYQRMAGKTVFYPMGFDDNGLPTERLVEKVKKVRATDMSREEFITLCEGVAEEAREEFRHLFQSVALSVDWQQEYHTISEDSRAISQLSFLDLFRKDRVYRKLQPMLWDPVDQTAIAQAEIEDKELSSSFNDICFQVAGAGSSDQVVSFSEKAVSDTLLSHARELRKNATDAEQLLWKILRNRQIEDLKFRRQHPVTPYVVDFFCHEANLIIELDGGQHNGTEQQSKDEQRTQFLESKGYRVLRFWNHDILQHTEAVVQTILQTLTPTLSQREREIAQHTASKPSPFGRGLGEGDSIIIGTTRPELIPACVAIFYHPEDERYQHLKGKEAITPLFNVHVPIMEDDTVEMDKGTGIMMCCTFGDEADIDKWRKYDLPARIVLNHYGKMNFTDADWIDAPEVTEALQNKKASNKDPKHPGAREIILQMLEESGALMESKPITHAVKCAERSGAPLEILPTQQWFVEILDQREALKTKAAECNWYPDWMKLRLDQWVDGLSWDWCISRQRYFGVPFPVWYSRRPGEEGKILVASPEQLPVNPLTDLPEGYTRDEVEAEADVMDTWATSSVSPQLSSKGISEELAPDAERHRKLFPADLRPQAHEIIRTWAFYTIVKAHLHEDTIPWEEPDDLRLVPGLR